MSDALIALRASLAEQITALRGDAAELPESLLDVTVRRMPLAGGDVFTVLPADWEALRHDEGAAGRPIPYWARLWPSGLALAGAVADDPPEPGTRVLELGCGLALPSLAAARAGASVLATDASTDAVAFAAHGMAFNEVRADAPRVTGSSTPTCWRPPARSTWCSPPTCCTRGRTSRRPCGCYRACSLPGAWCGWRIRDGREPVTCWRRREHRSR